MGLISKLIINCGTTHLTTGVISVSKDNKITVDKFCTTKLSYDYRNEEDWLKSIQDALRHVIVEQHYSGDAELILPGANLLTKIIKVPKVDASRQKQAIAYEVQQNIYHTLAEIVWESHIISDDGVELEVLFIAIKEDLAKKIHDIVSEQKLNVKAISPSTILEYNTYLLENKSNDKGIVQINVGARSTTILLISSDSFFIRNLPLGGNTITQEISDKINTSFIESEIIKLDKFSGSKSNTADSITSKLLNEQSESFIKKLGAELARTMANYKMQKPAFNYKKVYLSGGASRLPNLKETLSEKLNVPVNYAIISDKITLNKNVGNQNLNRGSLHISELIGQAIRNNIAKAISVDLIPQSLKLIDEFNSKKPYLIAAAVILLIAGFFPIFHLSNKIKTNELQVHNLENELTPLNILQNKISNITEDTYTARDNIKKIERLVNSKSNWINFFIDLQKRLVAVEDVWLEKLNVTRSDTTENNTNNSYGLLGITNEQVNEQDSLISDIELNLVGRMIDRANPLAKVSNNTKKRVNVILSKFNESVFISDVKNKKFDTTEKGILKFEFTLVLNPEMPL